MRTAAAQQGDKPATPQEELPFENKATPAEGEEEEVTVEVEGEAAPAEKTEPLPTVEGLQKQLQDLEKSERIAQEQRQQMFAEREAALADSQKYQTEATRSKLTVEEAQLETIETALGAATADAEAAQREIKLSIESGDADGQVKAYRRLAKAENYLGRLEEGKTELETRIERAKQAIERPVEKTQQDPIKAMGLPPKAEDWLRAHPEYLTDNRKNIKLQAAHFDALEEGHQPFSTGYFESMEVRLGVKKAEKPIEETEVERPVTSHEQKRTAIVSAPVSRDPPTGGEKPKTPSQVTLTKVEREHAKAAGITDAEYAKQKLTLQERKRNGHYGEH